MKKTHVCAFLILFLALLGGCNEKYPNLLNTPYPEGDQVYPGKNNKVLLITVDGLNGTALTEIGDAKIPTLAKMKKNALFSFRSLTDFSKGSIDYPIAYANLFTGVERAKHNYEGQVEGSDLSDYPSFIDRLKNRYPANTVGVFATHEDAIEDFVQQADVKDYAAADQDVIVKAIDFLNKENPSLLLVNLSNTEKVGKEVGYSIDQSAYVDAIKTIDQQVAELKDALEKRKDYALENWLIIVTSSQGAGSNTTVTSDMVYNDLRRNTFTMFYHRKFNSVPVATPNVNTVPFTSYSPVFNGSQADNNTATIPNDGGLYNFGTDEYTMRFTMKASGVATSWPLFLSKSAGINSREPGWNLYVSGQNLSMQVSGNDGYENFGSGIVVNDGKWHNVTVVFFRENGRRKVKFFKDGVKTDVTQDVEGRGTVNNSQPLRLGRNGADNNNPDVQVSHLQIYKGAWTDIEVQANGCRVEVNEASTHYDNLVGYWPSNEGGGNRLYNKAEPGVGKDFVLQGKYSWKTFSDVAENLCPEVKDSFYQVVPNAVDISTTIYAWLGIPVEESWKLDGKVWPFTFNSIRP